MPYQQDFRRETLDGVLAKMANTRSDDTFVCYGPTDQRVSYAGLNDRANAIGNRLRELGVDGQEQVSVMVRNPLQTLFSMLGVAKSGAIYSPVNYEYEGSILAHQLNDTRPRFLIVDDRYLGRLNDIVDDLEQRPHVIVRSTGDASEAPAPAFEWSTYDDLRSGASSDPGVDTACSDVAINLYTSGTTGLPKGVHLPHRWIFSNYLVLRQAFLTEEDTIHNPLPLYHVGGTFFNLLVGLVSGSSVILWDKFSTSQFWDRVEEYGATSVTLLSSMQNWLLENAESDDDHRNTLNKVHLQPLPSNYQEIANRFGFDYVTVGYGQTEAGLPIGGIIRGATGENATPPELRRGMSDVEIQETAQALGLDVRESVPSDQFMGRPLPSIVDVGVLDKNDEPLPKDSVGELAFRPAEPDVLFRRYHDAPEKTLETFGNLWYHTGDFVRYDEEGIYYFVDRQENIIRRHGENISSIHIQDEMNAHDAVSSSAVFPLPTEDGLDDEIGIAVELDAGRHVGEQELHEHIDSMLPAFMVPDHLKIVDELSTTDTNKIEKHKVREEVFSDQL